MSPCIGDEWVIPDSTGGWDSQRIVEFFDQYPGEYDFDKPLLIFFDIPPRIVELADDIGRRLPKKYRRRVALYTSARVKADIIIIENTVSVPINVVAESEFYTGEVLTLSKFKKWFYEIMNGERPWWTPAGTNRTCAPKPAHDRRTQ